MSVRCSHILIKHNKSRNPVSRRTGEEVTRSEEEALQILQGLKIDATNFGELARAYSDCSSYKQDGDLGFFKRGAMQKSFEDASFALKIGEISGIVSSDSGLHRIYRTG
jgi:NIMA-interacting peptidyl-prolyl cis-trans isomerase 1